MAKFTASSLFAALAFILLLMPVSARTVQAKEADCLDCHEQLSKGKVVHAAVQMGCTSCHSSLDTGDIPHKNKGKHSKGLSAGEPELCYGCHDRKLFKGKVTHSALSSGCTGCHNPHSSANAKLLAAELPELCFKCHDQGKFTGKEVHPPVKIGLCLSCHSAHRSENEHLLTASVPALCANCHDMAPFKKKNEHAPVAGGMCFSCHGVHTGSDKPLLLKKGILVCLECHGDVRKTAHVISGFSARSGHPVGALKKQKKTVKDPLRPDSEFYCVSCHLPHGSDWKKLYRYEAKTAMELCQYCHKF